MTTRLTKTLIAAGLLAGAVAGPALADDRPGPDWMPAEQAVRALEQAGYGNVHGIEADDGVWEGKASRDGRSVKVKVDPRSGAVTEKAEKAERKAGKADESDDDD